MGDGNNRSRDYCKRRQMQMQISSMGNPTYEAGMASKISYYTDKTFDIWQLARLRYTNPRI